MIKDVNSYPEINSPAYWTQHNEPLHNFIIMITKIYSITI